MNAAAPIQVRKSRGDFGQLFRAEKKRLSGVLHRLGPHEIVHIGSTAVSRLGGKNIIDMLLVLNGFGPADEYIQALSALGYELRRNAGAIGKRIFLQRGRPARFHLHIVKRGTREHSDPIHFRDYLRRRPALARRYYALKREWAREALTNKKYVAFKTSFVRDAVRKQKTLLRTRAPSQ